MSPEPKSAVSTMHCMDCGHKIEPKEPYYNLANHIICTVCWSAPPANGGKP